MSTPIILKEGDLIGRVHTVYSPATAAGYKAALFDFIVDKDGSVTISPRASVVTKTKKQLKDYPLGEQNGK